MRNSRQRETITYSKSHTHNLLAGNTYLRVFLLECKLHMGTIFSYFVHYFMSSTIHYGKEGKKCWESKQERGLYVRETDKHRVLIEELELAREKRRVMAKRKF